MSTEVTITADDNSGETVKIEYLPANAGMTEAELAAAALLNMMVHSISIRITSM